MAKSISALSRVLFLLVSAACMGVTGMPAHAQLPFFPGAEGYGGTWSGTAPAGGWLSNATVYHVTNLNDNGPGSLRNAFVQNSSNKVIVFDVAGTIELTSGSLDIKNLANYYIAGQTAPGPVTIYGDTTQLTHSSGKENRNVVLRYLSFRKGTGSSSDSITFAGSGLGSNLILDHLSASWAEDEILSVANNNTNVSVQYTSIHDALVESHAYGSLIRPRISSQVSFHHNLYANNASRQARFGTYNGETLTADFRNNLIYNWRDRASYSGGSSESEQEYADVNYVGNYLVAGPGTESNSTYAFHVDKNTTTRVYQLGNYIDPDDAPGGAAADGVVDGTDTGTQMFRVSTPITDQSLEFMASPFATPPVTTQSAPDAYDQVVNYVGNWWWNRDAIDSRVLGNVTEFTGVPIGASAPIASELNTVLAAQQVSHASGYDADNDGMEDAWEAKYGGDLVWNQDFDNDGYINLIEFINEKGEFPAPTPIVFTGEANTRYAKIENWRTDDGGMTAGSNWQPSKYDLALVDNGTVVVDAPGQHAGNLDVGVASGSDATLSIEAGWLEVTDLVTVGSELGTGRLTMSPNGELHAVDVAVGTLGTLDGSGTLDANVLNAGTLAPGPSIGSLAVAGDVLQSEAGRIELEIASASSYDTLEIGGDLFANGQLDVSLLGYSPQAGDTFDLLDFTTAFGLFDVILPTLDAGLAWDLNDMLSTGELSVVTAIVANADFDDDGDVDGQDFLIWQRGYGSVGTAASGDANGDGNVNADDLAIWHAQQFSPASVASSNAVPESGTLTVALAAALGLLLSRRN